MHNHRSVAGFLSIPWDWEISKSGGIVFQGDAPTGVIILKGGGQGREFRMIPPQFFQMIFDKVSAPNPSDTFGVCSS